MATSASGKALEEITVHKIIVPKKCAVMKLEEMCQRKHKIYQPRQVNSQYGKTLIKDNELDQQNHCKELNRDQMTLGAVPPRPLMSDPATASAACSLCSALFKQRGLKKHMASCKLKMANHARDNKFLVKEKLCAAQEILKAHAGNQGQGWQITLHPPPPTVPPSINSPAVEVQPPDSPPSMRPHSPLPPPLNFDDTGASSNSSCKLAPSLPVSEVDQRPQIDDIKCDYHPSSQ
ncbi:hypothetical protein BDN71DRAFT_1435784 [Pleurotus eryngii]|uniref:Uncharacterized protein n=1 Tax=Pleurotus eryngii TaxID=5323 RepID=A0A9P5ZIZ0_PLEER|nr:hypothetical protein BDN71DRAFT_1435784 [Pleurotus eryngii]